MPRLNTSAKKTRMTKGWKHFESYEFSSGQVKNRIWSFPKRKRRNLPLLKEEVPPFFDKIRRE
jgi:hypothetical protein